MKIGLITIGQSPRPDILPEMKRILGDEFEILEKGALDDYTLDDIKKREAKAGDHILVTRMRDGTEVKVTHELVVPLIQQRVSELDEEGVKVILLLCTGRFPEFQSNALIVMPWEIIRGAVNASLRKGRLGMVLPAKEQAAHASRRWGVGDIEVYADSASPYGPKEEVERLAERLVEKDLDLILLNCMGFGHRAKQIIKDKTGKPVIQANALVARVLKELAS